MTWRSQTSCVDACLQTMTDLVVVNRVFEVIRGEKVSTRLRRGKLGWINNPLSAGNQEHHSTTFFSLVCDGAASNSPRRGCIWR